MSHFPHCAIAQKIRENVVGVKKRLNEKLLLVIFFTFTKNQKIRENVVVDKKKCLLNI